MNEIDFGSQYFNIFGAVKDTVSANLLDACRREKIPDEVAKKLIAIANASIDQTASNAYAALWGQIQKFFRK
jgi:formaldehyde-activating enzyme involved in methanogenesis